MPAALIASVNLTVRAIIGNTKFGLLIRGALVPRRLRLHFRELLAYGGLVTRRRP